MLPAFSSVLCRILRSMSFLRPNRPSSACCAGFTNQWTVILCSFLYNFAGGIALALSPVLVDDSYGGRPVASLIAGLVGAARSFAQFCILPGLGVACDRFGRKPVMVYAAIGVTVCAALAVGAHSPQTMFLLFLSAGVQGASNGQYPASNGCAIDVTGPDHRALFFVYLFLLGTGICVVLPSLVAGILLSAGQSPLVVLLVGTAVGVADVVFALSLVQETLPPSLRQVHFNWKKANPIGALKLLLTPLLFEFTVGFMAIGFVLASAPVFYFYMRDVFGVAPSTFLLLSALNGVSLLAGSIASPWLSSKLGDRAVLRACALHMCAALLICAVAWSVAVFAVGFFLCGFVTVGQAPALNIVSRNTAPDFQGMVQSAVWSFVILAEAVGSIALTGAYYGFRGLDFPQFPFVLLSFLCILLFAGATYTFRRFPTDEVRIPRQEDIASPRDGRGSAIRQRESGILVTGTSGDCEWEHAKVPLVSAAGGVAISDSQC